MKKTSVQKTKTPKTVVAKQNKSASLKKNKAKPTVKKSVTVSKVKAKSKPKVAVAKKVVKAQKSKVAVARKVVKVTKPKAAVAKKIVKVTKSKVAVAKKVAEAPKAKTKKKDATDILTELIIRGIQEKKGKDIVCLDLRNIENAVCSYFIVCHGDSNTQVNAIADSIYDEVKKASGEFPWHKEGFQNAEWVLLDYSNVVVHIFQKEIRDYYNLEKLWADAVIKKIA